MRDFDIAKDRFGMVVFTPKTTTAREWAVDRFAGLDRFGLGYVVWPKHAQSLAEEISAIGFTI